MMDLLTYLLSSALGAALVGVPAWMAYSHLDRLNDRVREHLLRREAYLHERITALEDRLATHTLEAYTSLRSMPTEQERAAAVVNSFGEPRTDESYGENHEDVLEAELAARGVDLEGYGPVVR